MDDPPLATRRVTVRQEHGLHMRPAELVARTAMQYVSEVTLRCEPHRADAKSILELIGLVAECGAELVIEARGPDAEAAVTRLAELFENDFNDTTRPGTGGPS
ncbi:HPr family phosphocarrier protein [Botrimarina sp.]|uniref:HPr family phosphocarrier protein n=1 Tax=Botrimarina sp. TaxID=2795802 RepID=UPI0032EE60B1